MKKKYLLLIVLGLLMCQSVNAQIRTVGPVEQKVTTALCDCINHLDLTKISNAKEATEAFTNCFMNQSDLFSDLATERNISMTDKAAMHTLGEDIGKNLLKQKCEGFLKLAVKMANKDNGEPETQTTTGSFKRIDNKGFNYIVITDASGNDRSFLWLRQFPGSGKFITIPTSLIGKKINISWQELEVYLPQAKGYYKVKEITAITML